jgi:hypothetical protein
MKARAVLGLFLAEGAVQSGDVIQAADLAHQALASTINQPIVPILQQARRVGRLVREQDPAAGDELDGAVRAMGRALTVVAGRAQS